MKTAKKITKTILALLPILGVLLLFVTSINSKTETYPLHSSVFWSYQEGSATGSLRFESPNAPNSKIIGSLYSRYYNITDGVAVPSSANVYGASVFMARLGNTLSDVTGIPLSYILIPLWYAFYLFILEMSFMIVDIITFIPRKCGEFFGG